MKRLRLLLLCTFVFSSVIAVKPAVAKNYYTFKGSASVTLTYYDPLGKVLGSKKINIYNTSSTHSNPLREGSLQESNPFNLSVAGGISEEGSFMLVSAAKLSAPSSGRFIDQGWMIRKTKETSRVVEFHGVLRRTLHSD